MNRRRHSGFSMIELLVACTVATIGFLAIARLSYLCHRFVSRNETRLLMHQELQNVVEQVSCLPYEEVDNDAARKIAVPPLDHPRLKGMTLRIAVTAQQDPVPAKHIDVSIVDHNRQRGNIVRLSAWKYPEGH
jgi:prepilin-type N-terminal cleavage/methylation domain-containing protein